MTYRIAFPLVLLLFSSFFCAAFLNEAMAQRENQAEFAQFKRWQESGQVEQCVVGLVSAAIRNRREIHL